MARTIKRREDCFFGLHFDQHTNLKDTQLGARVSEALVRRIIRLTRPDYIQHDCKGHPGIKGYPDSRTGPSSPIVKDSLAIFRKVTKQAGVGLFVHFSGVQDRWVCGQGRPEWAAVLADGSRDPHNTSTFSAYVTELLIPQMKEIIDRYDVDGFWVDGECWSVATDHCDAALRRFREITGAQTPPTEPGQPHWLEWMTLHRDQFFAYLKTYMDAIHACAPRVQIASNWLYSDHCPEPVRLKVDFISGDYASEDSVNSARLNARYMSNVGLPWDLMAWAFVTMRDHGGRVHKPVEQLQQEAAAVLALGGGFQLYFHPDRHGGFAEHQLKLMKQVADFCHVRKTVCWKSEPLPQVALLLDSTSYLTISRNVYAPWSGEYNALKGALHAMLDAGHNVDVLADHMLPWQQDHWPVIAIPEWAHLPRGVVHELVEYARRGGSLLLIGAETCGLFREHLGVTFNGKPTDQRTYLQVPAKLTSFGEAGSILTRGLWQDVAPPNGGQAVKVLAHRTPGHEEAFEPTVAATLSKLGRGRVAAIYGPVASWHFRMHSPWGRDFLGAVLDRLYRPRVRIIEPETRGRLDLVVREKDERLVIHLNNTTGMPTHDLPDATAARRYNFIDRVPPVGPLTLQVRGYTAAAARRVRLEPDGTKLRASWHKGVLKIHVPPVPIHSAVVIG